jgi:hypothetical protein
MKTKPAWPRPILVDYEDPKKGQKHCLRRVEKNALAHR